MSEFLSTSGIACPHGKYLDVATDDYSSLECATKVELLDTKYDLESLHNLVSTMWEKDG